MFNLTLDQAKSWFFDTSDWDQILVHPYERALNRVGWILMKESRRNIRKRKKPSKPGQSPSRWSRKMIDEPGIQYIYQPNNPGGPSVLIGPMKFKGSQRAKPMGRRSIPEVLEKGGRVYEPDSIITRSGNWLGPRTVIIRPRPYMSKAYRQRKQKVLSVFHEFVGKDPQAKGIAKSLEG